MEQMFVSTYRVRRSPAAAALSAALHAVVAIGALGFTHAAAFGGDPRRPAAITFLASVPSAVLRDVRPAAHPAIVARQAESRHAVPVVQERPVPLPDASSLEEQVPAAPLAAAPLDAGVTMPRAPEVEIAAAAAAPAAPIVGAFDRAGDSRPRPASRPVGAIVAAGFTAVAGPRNVPAAAALAVRSGGFDLERTRPPAAASGAASGAAIDTPVEILSKTTPEYSDEGRLLRIEGAVVLDVEFTASGEVRVLGVLSSLGHGLDEAAAHAAAQIRFRPARAAGNPVDCRTTVRIVFRLI